MIQISIIIIATVILGGIIEYLRERNSINPINSADLFSERSQRFGSNRIVRQGSKLIVGFVGEGIEEVDPKVFKDALFVIDSVEEKYGMIIPDKIKIVANNKVLKGSYLELVNIVNNFC